MDEETWELLIKSFKKNSSNKNPSYLITLNGTEYKLTYEEPYSNFPEEISILYKESGRLIGRMNKVFFHACLSLDVIDYTGIDNLTQIIDRMEYYNNKREEERKEEIERREKKLDSFLYGDGQNV